MPTTILGLALVVLLPGDAPAGKETPRQSHPFAPSLPQLTDEEEDRIDRVIDRFIDYDTGKLQGEEGKKAVKEFKELGPEATFGLIRGLNRAAKIEGSCPALIIAKKLATIFRSTNDRELLQFARENIGLGVGQSRHMGILKDLRTICLLRQRSLPQTTVVTTVTRPFRDKSIADLIDAVSSEHGPRLKQVLNELEKRRGDDVVRTLSSVASGSRDAEIVKLARDLLASNLAREDAAAIRDRLRDKQAEVRAAAARAAGSKGLRQAGGELIELLSDPEKDVRTSAHEALARLAGKDFGPDADAGDAQRALALARWRDWWDRQGGR
jgi:hypothetical protein